MSQTTGGYTCKSCGALASFIINGECRHCHDVTLARKIDLAYPQPATFLQDMGVRVDEPSLERIRALVEETVRRVLHEEDVQEKQYFFVLNKVLSAEELSELEQHIKEHGLQSLAAYIPDMAAIEVPTFEKERNT